MAQNTLANGLTAEGQELENSHKSQKIISLATGKKANKLGMESIFPMDIHRKVFD
jgi:hypothetical protein